MSQAIHAEAETVTPTPCAREPFCTVWDISKNCRKHRPEDWDTLSSNIDPYLPVVSVWTQEMVASQLFPLIQIGFGDESLVENNFSWLNPLMQKRLSPLLL